MTARQEIDSVLAGIRDRLVSLSGDERIRTPVHGFVDDHLGYFLPDDAGNPDPGRWCTVFSERGRDEFREGFDSAEDLLWSLVESMLQTAATGWEVAHRIPHQDTRRAWFAKMAEWTAAYWPQWSARLAADQEATLAVAPFDDDQTVFVEFLDTLSQAQKQAVWALRDEQADRFRAAVVEQFRATRTLPDLRTAAAASGVTLRS